MTSARQVEEIARSHYSSRGGTTCSANKQLTDCETCDLLAALREAQAQFAFWEHEYTLSKDSHGERDALQRRVEELEMACLNAKQALTEYIRVVRSVNRPDTFTTEVADAGGVARQAIRKIEIALRGEAAG